MSREYTINDECNWCNKTKMVRYLYQDEIPVISICEVCDTPDVNTYTEFVEYTTAKENVMSDKPVKRLAEITGLITTEFDPTNTNNKENNTMSTTNSSIICEVKDCQKTGKFHMLVWALDFNAYALDHLPLPYQGGSWDKVEMDFCGIHKNVLHRGNAVQLKLAVRPVVSYDLNVAEQRELFNTEVLGQDTNPKEEDTMDTNYSTMSLEDLEAFAAELFQEGAEIHTNRSAYETEQEWQELLDETTAELTAVEEAINNKKEATMPTTKKILCGHCKGYHNTKEEVRKCYRPVVKLPMRQSKGVLCGNCRKNGVAEPYHATTAEVKACYMGKS